MEIGHYRLLKKLDNGGMAEIYLAIDTSVSGVERLVVIKRVLPSLIKDEVFLRMFLDEARIATRLSHPHIAHVYEVGQEGGIPYLAMEFVHGADLSSVLRQNNIRLSPALAGLIAARVAAALHHAHELTDFQGKPLNIVHRDISPQNLRISYEGVVKILDFGIAKAATNSEKTQAGVLKGKYAYMSPEQIQGLTPDNRADIFSLGVVLHEMLTYQKLFKQTSPMKIMREISQAPIPKPSESSDQPIPESLERIVMTALQQDRDQRYSSVRIMQRDLEDFLRSQPANEADLEEFMSKLFGNAQHMRAELLELLKANTLGQMVAHTASTRVSPHLMTMTPTPERPKKSPYTREIFSLAHLRRKRTLFWSVAIAAILAVATMLLLLLLYHLKKQYQGTMRSPFSSVPSLSTHRPSKIPASGQPRLILKTVPPGATVFVNQHLFPIKTPTVLTNIPAGKPTEVTVKITGYRAKTFTLTLVHEEVQELLHMFQPLPSSPDKAPLEVPVPGKK